MSVLILGASSEISKSLCHLLAKDKFNLILALRKAYELNSFSNDLAIRYGIAVKLEEFDILDSDNFPSFLQSLGELRGVVCAIGSMNGDFENIVKVNFLNIALFLNIVADDFKKNPVDKFIAAIGSVAGDRGRAKNYFYGSAKAGLHEYLSGLRNELNKYNIQVLTIKPGFINTKMTKDMDLPKSLTATPDIVALDIYKALKSKKDVIYSLARWRYIMMLIKLMPECIFKKLNL